MQISSGVNTRYANTSYQPKKTASNNTFETSRSSASAQSDTKVDFTLKMGCLTGGAVPSGQGWKSFSMNYDASSTKENPIMLVEVYDVNGEDVSFKIAVNEVDPRNASYLEMVALDAHMGGSNRETLHHFEGKGHPLLTKHNYVDAYASNIKDYKILGASQLVSQYQKAIDSFMEYYLEHN